MRDPEERCIKCQAEEYLNGEDWLYIEFYQYVSDQVDNLTPFGTESGKPVLTLRLESLVAACQILNIDKDEWGDYCYWARYIHGSMNDNSLFTKSLKYPIEELIDDD